MIDRWREYEFLRKKLDAPIADTRQAYHDLRILSEIFTQISGQIKPRDLIAFEQEIQVTRAKIQLQELQNDLQKVLARILRKALDDFILWIMSGSVIWLEALWMKP